MDQLELVFRLLVHLQFMYFQGSPPSQKNHNHRIRKSDQDTLVIPWKNLVTPIAAHTGN